MIKDNKYHEYLDNVIKEMDQEYILKTGKPFPYKICHDTILNNYKKGETIRGAASDAILDSVRWGII